MFREDTILRMTARSSSSQDWSKSSSIHIMTSSIVVSERPSKKYFRSMIFQVKKYQFTTRAIHSKNRNTQYQTVREKTWITKHRSRYVLSFWISNQEKSKNKMSTSVVSLSWLRWEHSSWMVSSVWSSTRSSVLRVCFLPLIRKIQASSRWRSSHTVVHGSR